MAKLTTTDVYGILTAHSNVVIKNDLTVGGILTASSLNASVFTVTSLNLISGIATTGPGLFFKTISTPAPASTIVSVYDGALYATSFNGPLTGNASGTAATVTGSTQANITNVSSAANGLTIAGTAGLILTVGSATTGAGTLFATSGTPAPAGTTKAVWDGNFYATKVYNAAWNDIAEFMLRAENSDSGDVIVMTNEGVKKSFKRAQKSVIGVNSDTFGFALGAENQENKTPIGLAGKVNVKVKEKLKIGDLLVSDCNGFATKASFFDFLIPGIIFGKVLEEKNDTNISRISILIMNR